MAVPKPVRWLALPLDLLLLLWACLLNVVKAVWPAGAKDKRAYCERVDLPSRDRTEKHDLCLRSRAFVQLGVFRVLCPYCQAVRGSRGSRMRECMSPTRRFPPVGRWFGAVILGSVLLVALVSLVVAGALRLAGRDPIRTVANLRHVFSPSAGKSQKAQPAPNQAEQDAAAAKAAAGKAEALLANAREFEKQGKFKEAVVALKELLGSVEPTAEMHVSIARLALRGRDRQEARFQLQEAIRLDPSSKEAISLLARLQFAEFQFNEALASARQLVTLDPENVRGQVLVCRCLRELGKVEPATKLARGLLRDHPENVDVELVLADLLANQRQWPEAEEHYQAILKRNPDHIGAALGLAKTYQRQDRGTEAEAILAKLRERIGKEGPAPPGLGVYERGVVEAEKQPGTGESRLWVAEGHMDTARLAEAMARYAETQLARGDQAGAIETYRRLTAHYPTLYQSRGRLAELLIREGRMDEAYQIATKLIADHPHDVGADIALGTILHSRGLSSLAETYCQDALSSQDPRAAAIHTLYGRMAMAKGEADRAIQQFHLAIERRPSDPTAAIQLAHCLTAQGKADKAIQALWEAVERCPAAVSLQLELGQLYVATNRFDEALKRYRAASTVEPVNPAALSNLGMLLLKKGEVDESLATLLNARKLFPDHPIIAQSLAVAQTCKGDFKSAVDNLRFAVERVPGNLNFQYDLAVALRHSGQETEALMVLRRALNSGRNFRRRQDATKLLALLSPEKQEK